MKQRTRRKNKLANKIKRKDKQNPSEAKSAGIVNENLSMDEDFSDNEVILEDVGPEEDLEYTDCASGANKEHIELNLPSCETEDVDVVEDSTKTDWVKPEFLSGKWTSLEGKNKADLTVGAWNVRGIGNKSKRGEIERIIKSLEVDLCAITEHHKE